MYVEVNSSFDVTRLSPGLECYSVLPGRIVAVQDRTSLAIVFLRPSGDLTCDCPEAQRGGTCDHVCALRAGLWARLSLLPRGRSLVLRTQEWCARKDSTSPVCSGFPSSTERTVYHCTAP